MLILHDPKVLSHNTIELLGARLIPALESPSRIVSILSALSSSQHQIQEVHYETDSKVLSLPYIRKSHDQEYLKHLQHAHSEWVRYGHIEDHESILPECFPSFSGPGLDSLISEGCSPPKDIFARSGYYAFDMSSGIMSETYDCAMASAGLACKASSMIISADDATLATLPKVVVALCRPPGHHCDTRRAGGYCYLNNAVVASEFLVSQASRGLSARADDRVAILDIDFHHGNGTQSYFYDRKVTYVSIHGEDEYPYYTGKCTETGQNAGSGFTHNFPLPAGTSVKQYIRTLSEALVRIDWDTIDYLVISLGFDTFELDPLGSFKLDVADYRNIASIISEQTEEHNVRSVILLEGGYVIDRIGACFVSFCDGWK